VLEVLEGRTVPSFTVLPVAGTPQSTVVATAFATPLQALVEDASSNPVAGVSVTFAEPTGVSIPGQFPGGTTSVTVSTNASGIATAPTFTANFRPTQFIVTASVADGTSASFDLTILAGPPAGLGTVQYTTPQAATEGTPFGTTLQVTVKDAFQNAVAGVNVVFVAPSSGPSGTFPGAATSVTVTTDVTGTATAPTFTANSALGSYVVTASVSGVASPATFNLLNVSPDAVFDGPSGPGQVQAVVIPAGGVGSIIYTGPINDLGSSNSTLSGLTSFTFNGHSNADYLIISLASGSPLLPGPVRFNTGAGSHVLDIVAPNAGGSASCALVTGPGGVIVDGQTVLYSSTGSLTLVFSTASAVNAWVVPLYPAPPGAFVKGPLLPPGQIGPGPIPFTPSERFVQVLYLDVLGRVGSVAEVEAWASQVDAWAKPPGTGLSPLAVAGRIEGSFEARDRLVSTWYSTYLGRQEQGTEGMAWVALLGSQSEEQVLSQFLGDTVTHEFYDRAQRLIASGTPDERYIQALYQVLLGRFVSGAELAAWNAGLATMGRQGLALAVLSTQEFRTDQFEGYYNALLHRPDDAPGLQAWVNAGLDILGTRLDFESSPEFFSNG
jgi:hypothetical protein